MTHSNGYRRNTRHLFSRPHRKHGVEHLSTYMHIYKRGGAFHKGMPYRYFHGRTGKIFDVTRRAVGVIVNKRVKGRIIPKRIHIRVEHVHPSRCNEDYLARKAKRIELAKTHIKGEKIQSVKRKPEGPKPAHFVKFADNSPIELRPLKFVSMF
ncbi:hypothetical protein MXB_2209 [Myxobolus squamalis]|nr:hypothetical protein MXB_2209 [Myxobolus squamalis]